MSDRPPPTVLLLPLPHRVADSDDQNPRNVGSLDKNAEDVGTGLVGAPACGDVMKLQIKVRCGANDNHPTHPLISVGAMDITRRPDDPGA